MISADVGPNVAWVRNRPASADESSVGGVTGVLESDEDADEPEDDLLASQPATKHTIRMTKVRFMIDGMAAHRNFF